MTEPSNLYPPSEEVLAASRSEKTGQIRADLSGRNLSDMDLRRIDLSYVNLAGAKLRRSDLSEASFEHADLSEARIRDAHLDRTALRKAIFRDAEMQKVSLRDADLTGADLRRAKLREADLQGADLRDTRLQHAELTGANLTGTVGLSQEQLAGADVAGARLPEELKTFSGLATVEETSKTARSIFLATLLACAYIWLTIASTTDAQLLTNSGTSKLPVIATDISIAWFFIIVPALLLLMYAYFHFHLQGLWEELATLPAIFVDGRPLHRRSYPWLVNEIVRSELPVLKPTGSTLTRIQDRLVVALVWGVVPLTILGCWLRFIVRRSMAASLWQALLAAISILAAFQFHRLARWTLQQRQVEFWLQRARLRRALGGGLVVLAVLCVTSWVLITGIRREALWRPEIEQADAARYATDVAHDARVSPRWPRVWLPNVLKRLGVHTFASFDLADVSARVDTPSGFRIKGAALAGSDLRYATARGAFLDKADLTSSDLRGVDLSNASLEGAQLDGASFAFARLFEAKMIDVHTAQGTPANFTGATLTSADFGRANLEGANFSLADLGGTIFRSAMLKRAVMPLNSNCDFSLADLRYVDFRGRNLAGADLSGATFRWTRLQHADLTGAKLAEAEFGSACYDTATRWPQGFDPSTSGALLVVSDMDCAAKQRAAQQPQQLPPVSLGPAPH
jgi:uncharacterized protein YjbI with pentapeptide repeats